MKKSKRGISLVVVIVTVMALIIFSSVIFTASARSLSMTGISTDSRQTYLKAKSAIQYAHMLVCEKAKKNGSLTEFSVGPAVGDSFKELPTSCSPDGTKCYAQCKNVSGSQWKISALVKGKNSGKMQKLNYTFTLTFNGAMSPNTFLLAGARYDYRGQVINSGKTANSFNLSTDAQSPYPMVFSKSDVECNSTVKTRVPEAYFINDGGLQFGADADHAQWTLSSNFVYFKTKLTADATKNQHLILKNKLWASIDSDNTDYQILQPDANDSSYVGIVCFGTDNAVQIAGASLPSIAAGYYYFKDQTDLLDSDSYTNGKLKRITNMAEIEGGHPDITVQMGNSQSPGGKFPTKTYVNNVNYLNSSTLSTGFPLVSSESAGGIGWTTEGKLQSGTIDGAPQAGKDVYLNLCPAGLGELNNFTSSSPLKLTAHSITFEIENLRTNVFTAPLQHFIFQVDPLDTSNTTSVPGRLWLNVQNYNGSPWLNHSEETVLRPSPPNVNHPGQSSALYAGYPADSSKSVILVLPHGLKVEDLNGKPPFELKRQFTDPSKTDYVDPHDPSTYTYTVPCGTNLLDVDAMRVGMKKYVSIGGPIPGGNSYTITDGKYTFS